MNRAMIRSLHLFFLLMMIQTACNMPVRRPIPNGPTAALPTTALPTPTLFSPGPTLASPPATQGPPTSAPIPTAVSMTQTPGMTFLGQHQIRTGETLFCIARAYGVLPAAIIQANNIVNVDALVVGQMLNIPQAQWTDMTAGQVCDKQFNSPFPTGPTAVASNPATSPPPTYQDLKRELYLSLGGGGGMFTDCVIEYEVFPPATTPAISGMWSADFLGNKGVICLFGFPLDQVITVSLLDRQAGNVLYGSSFIVHEEELLQINASGKILEKAGYVHRASSVPVMGLYLWPDPRVRFVKVTATNLVLESHVSPVRGLFVDFAGKTQAGFDPFGGFDPCPDFPVGSEIKLYGFGFDASQTATAKVYSTKAGLGDANYPDIIVRTNSQDLNDGTILTIDRLFRSYAVTPNPDGSFQINIPTDSLSPSGVYILKYEPDISAQISASLRNCFSITNRQLVYADRLPVPPVIDGDSGEWATLINLLDRQTYGFENWSGFSDLSGWFSIGWDDTFLYIAASVVDDRYVQSQRDELMYQGDSLEILLGEPLSVPAELRPTDYQLGFSLGNLLTNEPPSQAYLWYPANKRGSYPGVIVKGRQKPLGYDMEIAIPWAVLERVPVLGQQFKFALSASDNDAEGAAVQQSLVSSISGRVLTDPATWGVLLLGD